MGFFRKFVGRFGSQENEFREPHEEVVILGGRGENDAKAGSADSASMMYAMLEKDEYRQYPFSVKDLGDGMAIVDEVISGYWKPRFLVDNRAKRAVEFMDVNYRLKTVEEKDVDWDSLSALPEKAISIARNFLLRYPSFVKMFKNGVAEVSWQLNPDGYYFMDSDGFGMTDDKEVTVYGFIDRNGKVVVPFRLTKNSAEVAEMRKQAEAVVSESRYFERSEPVCKDGSGNVRIYNLVIIDESGSMGSIKKPAIDSVNETLQTIKSAQLMHSEQEHFVTLVSFNGKVKTIYDCERVDNVKELDDRRYIPSGLTALYDAMGISINRLRRQVSEGGKVVVTIVTDGYENASREYRGPAIKELVQEMRKKGWVFAYIGANQDVEAVAASMSISSSMRFNADVRGTEMMSHKVSHARCMVYSSIADDSFSADDANENFFRDDDGKKKK